MRRLFFLLSGEHPTLPASDVLASIEAEGYDYEVEEKLDQILVAQTEADPKVLSERIAMTHMIGQHFFTSRFDEIPDALGSSDLIEFLPHGESIAVRIKRIKRYSQEADVRKLSKEIADQILEEIDYEVDLSNPDNEIVGILSEDRCVLGITKERVDRSEFDERRPPKRPTVHPGTLQPSFARVMVNLARTLRGGRFLDPFCGVGGILLEAGLIGAKPIGLDIKPDLIEGAEENLKGMGVDEFELQVGDARELSIEKVDSIATDPPYGRQASLGGSELEELYKDALPVLSETLREGHYLCISAPKELDMGELAKDIELSLEEEHEQRVHKDLTRKIYVFRRKGD